MASSDELPEGAVPPTVESDLDAVDACMFSGDGFHSRDGLARLRWFLARWSKEADAIAWMLDERDKQA